MPRKTSSQSPQSPHPASGPPGLPRGVRRGRRLALPAGLSAGLGYDAVGMSAEHGKRVMDRLPRLGCVFACDEHWWWIVPAGSHIGLVWPADTSYSVGAYVRSPGGPRAARASRTLRLIHRPEGDSPYTPPIPLYFMACHIAGVMPSWSVTE